MVNSTSLPFKGICGIASLLPLASPNCNQGFPACSFERQPVSLSREGENFSTSACRSFRSFVADNYSCLTSHSTGKLNSDGYSRAGKYLSRGKGHNISTIRAQRSELAASPSTESAKMIFAASPAMGHHSEGHPESNQRVPAILAALESANIISQERQEEVVNLKSVPPAMPASIESVYSPAYIRGLAKAMERAEDEGLVYVDNSGPTFATPTTYMDCLRGAGVGTALVDKVAEAAKGGGRAVPAFALVRPPGHHAAPSGPMGFCLVDHIAVAARHAQILHGLKRVMIIDFDVHHGNGTQDIFFSDPDVFFLSTHQIGSYPGTGKMAEVGEGPGEGANLNLPLPGGAGHTAMTAVVDQVIAPAVQRFKPDIILVSAGYDAHYEDPLAGMQFTTGTYYHLAKAIHELALQTCQGRLVFFLEGGYGLKPLSNSVVDTFRALLGEPSGAKEVDNPLCLYEEPMPQVLDAISQVRSMHSL